MNNIPPLSDLIDAFARLPGIGKKTAARLAFYILKMPESYAKSFADALINARPVRTLLMFLLAEFAGV